MTNITVIGSGYVGLVHGVCLADVSHKVVIYDIDKSKVTSLQNGAPTFFEPGLEEMIKKNLSLNRLRFTNKLEEALHSAHVYFICVSTPPNVDGSANLDSLFSVGDAIAKHAPKEALIVIKSTVPPGTARLFSDRLKEKNRQLSFKVLSNPEFLQEGVAIKNCMKPDRIVIGYEDSDSAHQLESIYSFLPIKKDQIVLMNFESAEMTKYAANFMLAGRISMINEITRLTEEAEANIDSVIKGLSFDPRIGNKYLSPGIGFGGSCFPKDLEALNYFAKKNDVAVDMLTAVKKANARLIPHYINKITSHFKTNKLDGLTFAIWGVAYKSGTDDIRGSPAIEIVKLLLQYGGKLIIFDPLAMKNARGILGDQNITWAKDALTCVKNCDALCLLTDHSQFQDVDLKALKQAMNSPLVFDGRNFLSKEQLIMLKFTYFGMGIQWSDSQQELESYAQN